MLTGRYLDGIPADSRAGHDPRLLKPRDISEEKLARVRALNDIAARRGQSLAQMALSWTMRIGRVISALIGASRPQQITENVKAIENTAFTEAELSAIDGILAK